MKITKALHTTTKCVRDSWGTTIVKGSEIYDGLCYYFVGTLHYKPVPNRCAAVPAASLLYIGIGKFRILGGGRGEGKV